MRESALYLSTVGRVLDWSRSNSLWYTVANAGCCSDEMLNTLGCRYDFERFGSIPQIDARQSDLLIISGPISYKMVPHVRALYDLMPSPKYVLALGSCANCGGPFAPEISYSTIPGVDRILPVDIYVPGCPPRPEAIMDGLLALQGKIRG